MNKVAFFVFNDDPMCFIHVLLNANDMKDREYEVTIVLEGSATKLVPDLVNEENPLNFLWVKSKERGLVGGVCKVCSNKMGVLEAVQEQNLTLLDDMKGHPGMAGYREKGFEVMIF